MTVGDNNYNYGACSTIYNNIGKYYGKYFNNGSCIDLQGPQSVKDQLFSSSSSSSSSSSKTGTNRFYPTLGNHDWDSYSVRI